VATNFAYWKISLAESLRKDSRLKFDIQNYKFQGTRAYFYTGLKSTDLSFKSPVMKQEL
jgi:hypothetical protein